MFAYRCLLLLLLGALASTSGFQIVSPTRTRTRSVVIGDQTTKYKSIPPEYNNFLSSNSSDDEEPDSIKEVPESIKEDTRETNKTVRDATFNIFKLFSYCIQFLGAFFFIGLILNFVGYGYTVDLEHGLVIDRLDNIRNEIQFEREIERDTMEGSKYLIAPKVPE